MKENPERYRKEQAQEEASRMQQMFKSGEVASYSEAEQKLNRNIEQELSPEIVERVMEKVKDINKDGNGVTALRCYSEKESIGSVKGRSKLISVLENGLLGLGGGLSIYAELTETEKSEALNRPRKDQWAHQARKYHVAYFFANIIGRDIKDVEDSLWAQDGEITFIFDLKNFKPALTSSPDRKAQSKTYRTELPIKEDELELLESAGIDPTAPLEKVAPQFEEAIPKLREILKNDHDKLWHLRLLESRIEDWKKRGLRTSRDWGFAINHRVAPRNFIGIVLNPLRPKTPEEIERFGTSSISNSGKMIQTSDPKILEDDIRILVRQMTETYQGKERLILPIYDREGNLLWPEKRSYEDIRKYESEVGLRNSDNTG